MAFRNYFRQSILNPGWIVLWVRLLFVSTLLFYSYTWLKLDVPLINWRIYDSYFWNLDIALHGGFSPSLFCLALFNNRAFLWSLDSLYGIWLFIALITQGFFTASLDPVLRKRYMFSIVLIWIVGVWIYIGWPALGPVYFHHSQFAQTLKSMPSADFTQRALMANYNKVVLSRSTGIIKAPFNPSLGIAAMPSLHVGLMWLFFLWSRRLPRAFPLFFFLYTILVFVGSLVSGWHYAVDGYVGVLIAWLSYRGALLTERTEEAAQRVQKQETFSSPELPDQTAAPSIGDHPPTG